MKESNRTSAIITIAIIVGFILVVVGPLLSNEPAPAQFSTTITGEFSQTISAGITGNAAVLSSGSRVLVGKFQTLGFASQSKKVLVTLGYLGNEMPPAGTYDIQEPSRGKHFFGVVVEYSRADAANMASIFDVFQVAANTRQYYSTDGSITFEEVEGAYKGQFVFTALRDSSDIPIQVVGTFANLRRDLSE